MADREAFLAALEKGRGKLLNAQGEPVFPGWSKQIAYCFSDTNECWVIDVVDGRPLPLTLKEADSPDVRFTMTTDTLVGLMDGRINGMRAFTSGQVKVKASMADIRKLQTLV